MEIQILQITGDGTEYIIETIIKQFWKIIPEYLQYEVSLFGEFRRIGRNGKPAKPIKTFKHKDTGYITITLSRNGIIKTFNAHRLVALTHIANPFNYSDVDHIDEDKENNRVINLRWLSHQDNIKAYHQQRRDAEKRFLLAA